MTKVAVLVGSLQKNSFNKKLAAAIERQAEDMEFHYVDMNLPLFNQDLESNVPEEVKAAKQIVDESDAVLIVTPEYNRTAPGLLVNAIDWLSRPYGDNSFSGKPVAMAGASVSPLGTAVSQNMLRHTLTYLNTKLMGQPEVYFRTAQELFDDEGNLDEEHDQELANFVKSFDSWIKG